MWKALASLALASLALTACGGGGASTVVPTGTSIAPTTDSGAPQSASFNPSNVTISEIPVAGFAQYNVNASGNDYPLAVSTAGTVYFGTGGGYGGSDLYAYNGSSFTQTAPAYDDQCGVNNASSCCPSSEPCTGPGVTAIDAASVASITWAGETIAAAVPSGLIFVGANGGQASAPPAPYDYTSIPLNPGSFFLSLVTDTHGKLWYGGGGNGAFGYPANLSTLACSTPQNGCWDGLWLANGPNNHVWGMMHVLGASSQPTSSILLEFDASGTILHSYSIDGSIGAIVGDNNGALWFTNTTQNTIERISGSGAISDYAIPTPNSGAASITESVDGALWFTEPNANKIGRLDPTGHFSEFTLPTKNADPVAIAADPVSEQCSANVVWVLEAGPGNLAKVQF